MQFHFKIYQCEIAELHEANEILKDALGFSQKTERSKDIRATPFCTGKQGQVQSQNNVLRAEDQQIWVLPPAEKPEQTHSQGTSFGRDQSNT